MFHGARLKLTGWYLLIIMSISLSFSAVVYRVLTNEVENYARSQRFRIERQLQEVGFFHISVNYPELVEDAKNHIALTLILVNCTILVISGGLGYLLAGKTLHPIEEMLDEQKRFVADASHELRTPITSMRTEMEVALRDKKFNTKDAKHLLRSNLEELQKMQYLSDYLLSLSRYRANTKLEFKKIKLNDAINKAAHKIESLAKNKNIKIKKNLIDIEIKGNFIAMVELFTILLDNAIKYSHENSEVIVWMEKNKNNVLVTVRDFGIGIKASDIPYIFNRFYRADVSRTKGKVDGYGLGLSIAKSIVEMHSGKIEVESTVDKGSTFKVFL
jgi:signal transduction histidine kinase